ncbi:MAG: multiheme c-type cytochrome [Gammaproteobacteria bacterium]|nr:multiheme c-type cytochrome [Gammaproteobacteria bacterium]
MICLASYGCNSTPSTVEAAVASDAPKPVAEPRQPEKNVAEAKKPVKAKEGEPKPAEDANLFNRLLKSRKVKSKSLKDDGIHDPAGPGVKVLQNPQQAFKDLPKAKGGNAVDWVKALNTGKIKPRSSLEDPKAEALVMDMNIIREVKGSMPNVLFPHKQHTQHLDCTNCHPDIFIPMKGANKMSMAKNLMGQQCGVCHGKVAFPLSRCTACHSQKKAAKEIKKTKWKWP